MQSIYLELGSEMIRFNLVYSVNEQTGDEHSSALLQSPRSAIYNACTYQEKESLVKSKRS